MHTAENPWCWYLIGSHFYLANIQNLYWEYDTIASAYNGFTITEIKQMVTRERQYWVSMAKWKPV